MGDYFYEPEGGCFYGPLDGCSYEPVGGCFYGPLDDCSYEPVGGCSYGLVGGCSYEQLGGCSYGRDEGCSYEQGEGGLDVYPLKNSWQNTLQEVVDLSIPFWQIHKESRSTCHREKKLRQTIP